MSKSTLVTRTGGLFVVVLACVFSAASTGPDPEAVRACKDFVDVVCERSDACGGMSVDECEEELEEDFGDCNDAFSMDGEDDIDDCLDDLETMSCEDFGSGDEENYPRSCDEVEFFFPR